LVRHPIVVCQFLSCIKVCVSYPYICDAPAWNELQYTFLDFKLDTVLCWENSRQKKDFCKENLHNFFIFGDIWKRISPLESACNVQSETRLNSKFIFGTFRLISCWCITYNQYSHTIIIKIYLCLHNYNTPAQTQSWTHTSQVEWVILFFFTDFSSSLLSGQSSLLLLAVAQVMLM